MVDDPRGVPRIDVRVDEGQVDATSFYTNKYAHKSGDPDARD